MPTCSTPGKPSAASAASRTTDRLDHTARARRTALAPDIAAARADILALLAHIDAQDAEIAALREAVRNLGGDPDQAWYWTDAWQAKEREADEDLRAGRYADADDIDTLLAD